MYINYNGALRGAGDTFYPALATGCLCWGMTVFGGYAVARWRISWGPAGPWSVATCYGVILGLFMLIRFRCGKWKAIRSAPSDSQPQDAVREPVAIRTED
jgi:Na+-driven multidrug efflux pump